MTYPAALAADRMARSRKVVDALLASIDMYAGHGSDTAAVTLLAAAATVSRRRHTGCFTNRTLESQLRAIGGRLRTSVPQSKVPERAGISGQTGGVLHVMTRAYAAGGHTRLVERWIQGETDVVSSVVLTQHGSSDPAGLTATVTRSGGEVYRLEGSAADRVAQLRSLAAGCDRLVLSIHENDVVALLALAGMHRRPLVLVLNHAEHVYWAGASLADVVVNLRAASSDLAVTRRGIQRDRCVEVALPVSKRRRRMSVRDARRFLGIEAEHKVLLTVGWQYKYTPYCGDDLISALSPILSEPDVRLIAVGPRAGADLWSAAHAQYGGRVHAVGPQDDIQPYLDAADVFVDSYPVASLTASLEAAMSGLPVVGLAPRSDGWPRILHEDDSALADAMYSDIDAYRARITALLRDEGAQRAAARSLQALSTLTHGPDAWAQAMHRVHQVLDAAAQGRRRSIAVGRLGSPGTEDDILATYIADCEDSIIRPELGLQPDPSVAGETYALNARLRRIDDILLQAARPGAAAYDEALLLARG